MPNSTADRCGPPSWCWWRDVGCVSNSLGITTVEDSKTSELCVRIYYSTHTSKANNKLIKTGHEFPVFSAQQVWRSYCPQTRTLNITIVRDRTFDCVFIHVIFPSVNCSWLFYLASLISIMKTLSDKWYIDPSFKIQFAGVWFIDLKAEKSRFSCFFVRGLKPSGKINVTIQCIHSSEPKSSQSLPIFNVIEYLRGPMAAAGPGSTHPHHRARHQGPGGQEGTVVSNFQDSGIFPTNLVQVPFAICIWMKYTPRKIRLIEGNAKCCDLKKFTCQGILRQVFICLWPLPSEIFVLGWSSNFVGSESG